VGKEVLVTEFVRYDELHGRRREDVQAEVADFARQAKMTLGGAVESRHRIIKGGRRCACIACAVACGSTSLSFAVMISVVMAATPL
jgi:hypothetical protein